MDFEYESQPASTFHADSMRNGGRVSRCPALSHRSWSSFSAAPYHGSPAQVGWQQSPYMLNQLTAFHPQPIPSGYSGYLPARAPSVPNHLPEPRGSYLSRPQETDVSVPAVHNPSGYAAAGPSLDISPPATMAPSSGPTSASLASAADRQVFPSPNVSPPHTRSLPTPIVESPGHDTYSPSPSSSSAHPQTSSTASVSAQHEDQSSSVRPPQSHSTVRVRLPAPGNGRQRNSPNEQRLTMTLGHYARYRDVADYYEGTENEAAHATASQTSDDDSDRDFSPNPYISAGHTYLRNARQSQILRGQMNNKRVASKKAIQSLQQVDVDSLPDTEKSMSPHGFETLCCFLEKTDEPSL